MGQLIAIAFRNVMKNWRHSVAAIISVSAGLISLVLFQGYMSDVKFMYEDSYRHRTMYGDAMIEHKDVHSKEGRSEPLNFALTKEDQNFINEFAEEYSTSIYTTVRFLYIQGMITNGKTSTIYTGPGYDIIAGAKARQEAWEWDTLYGVPLQKAKVSNPIVIGQALGTLLGCKPLTNEDIHGGRLGYVPKDRPFECYTNQVQVSLTTESEQLNALDLDIVGMIDSGYKDVDNKYGHMSLTDAQTLMNTDKITTQTFQFKNPADTMKYINIFNEKAKTTHPHLLMQRWQDNHFVSDIYDRIMNLFKIFRNFVVTVIVSIAGLSTLNTMVKVVKERTKEIGTLRSLGFNQSQVKFLFVTESLFLSLLGIVAGIILALVFQFAINSAHIYYKGGLLSQPVLFRIQADYYSYVASIICLNLLSIVTSYLACRHTVNKNIAENLSYA